MTIKSPLFARRHGGPLMAMTAAALSFGLAAAFVVPDDALAKRKKKSSTASVVKKPELPLVINISLRQQRLTVFKGTRAITGAPVSSGSSGRETPLGIFSVIGKRRMHYSNLYNSAPMPFMQRITWSGIALHHGKLPGYPASHGCIRLPYDFSKNLFSITGRGTRVIVSRDPVSPRRFAHARLFRPLPPVEDPVLKTAPKRALISEAAAADAQGAAPVKRAAGGQVTTTSAALVTPADAGQTTAPPAAAPTAAPAAVQSKPVSWVDAAFPGRRSRTQLVAARKARLKEHKTAVATAKQELVAARQNVRAKKRALSTAAAAELFVRSQVKKLNRAAKQAKYIAVKASKDLVNFENTIAGQAFDPVIDAAKFQSAVAREDALETRYFELSENAELARHDADSMNTRLTSDRSAVGGAGEMLSLANAATKLAVYTLGAAKEALKKAKREQRLYNKPIAVFISRKKARIYVRQGFEPVLDAAVTIADPDQPMGTHIYTALDFTDDKANLNWSVISIKGDAERTTKSRRSRRKRKQPEKAVDLSPSMLTAARALARIEIPTDVAYRIAELIKPGSSLIISDRRMSQETGWGTDFIVSLR